MLSGTGNYTHTQTTASHSTTAPAAVTTGVLSGTGNYTHRPRHLTKTTSPAAVTTGVLSGTGNYTHTQTTASHSTTAPAPVTTDLWVIGWFMACQCFQHTGTPTSTKHSHLLTQLVFNISFNN